MDPTRTTLDARRSTGPRLGLPLVVVLATSALAMTGCSKFYDLPEVGSGEISEDVPDDTPLADGPSDDTADTGPDGAEDAPDVAADVADVADVADIDDAQDIPDTADTADAGDATDVDAADVPACDNPCEEAGKSRCAPDAPAKIETCTANPDTGCTSWQESTTCTSPSKCIEYVCDDTGGQAQCVEDPSSEVQCEDSGIACKPNVCDPQSGECKPSPLPIGTACEDGDPCTTGELCNQFNECVGNPDFTACPCADDAACEGFDDGDKCNGVYACQGAPSGVCVMQPPVAGTCPVNPDVCLNNVCNPATGQCEPEPVPNGLTCNDNNKCTSASSCQDGVCEGQGWKQCPAGTCETPVCDPDTAQCSVEVIPNCCGNGTPEGDEQCDGPAPDCAPGCTLPLCQKGAVHLGTGACLLEGPVTAWAGPVGPLTVELYVRPEAGPQDATLFVLPLDGGSALRLAYEDADSNGTPELVWHDADDTGAAVSFVGPTLVAGQWQHVVVQRDPEATGPVVQWFYNGFQQTLPAPGPLGTPTPTAAAMVGCGPTAGENSLRGDLDELRVSSVLRYAGNFALAQVPFETDADTLALYHFDERIPGRSGDAAGTEVLVWAGATPATDDAFSGKELAGAECAPLSCTPYSLALDASNAATVALASPAALDTAQDLTVEFFLRVDGPADGVILGRGQGIAGAQDWDIRAVAAGSGVRLKWTEGQFGGQDNPVVTQGTLEPGWHHVAVARTLSGDGASAQATLWWWLDGVAETGAVISGALALTSTDPLYVGSTAGTEDFLTLGFDELRISAGRIYDGNFSVPTAMPPRWDTLLLMHFDEGAGNFTYGALREAPGPGNLFDATWSEDQPAGFQGCL